MKSELTEIFDDLLSLAQKQDWPPVVAALEDLMDYSEYKQAAVVVSATDADLDCLLTWARGVTSFSELRTTSFADINLKARVTPHLIAYFPGDHLIEAAEVEAVARDFFTRPAHSYAVAINVDNLPSEEDLKVVERTAWRLLVNDPPSNSAHAELRDFDVYLWSDGEPAAFVTQRVQADKQALSAWLRGLAAGSDVLVTRQLTGLLQVGEAIYRQQRTKRLSSQASWTKDLAAAMDNISDFRGRLNRRLDGDAEMLVVAVAGAMRDWTGQLKESIQSALLEAFGNSKTIRPETAGAIVENKLREASPVWANGIAGVISSQHDELKRDSEGLFEVVDWKIINEVAAKSGLPTDYPEALLARAFDSRDTLDDRVSNAIPPGSPKRKEGVFARNLIVLGLPTMGIGVAASWMMGFPVAIPMRLAAGVAAGLISTVAATESTKTRCDADQCRVFAADAVKHFLDRSISHFQGETRIVAARFRQRVGEELRKLDELLGKVMQENYVSTAGSNDKEIIDRIEGLRNRLEGLIE